MTDNSLDNASAESEAIAYAGLHADLLSLTATRSGFEGLSAALIGNATSERIRLMPSGDQLSIDGVDDGDGQVRRAMQSKRYGAGSSLDQTSLRGEMDRACESFIGLDTWILATTKPFRGKEAEALRGHAERLGVGLIVLDWADETHGLPDLGVLCAAYPEAAGHFVKSPGALADLDALRAHPLFESSWRAVLRKLNRTDVGFGATREAACARLKTIHHDAAAARRLAGPSPAYLSEAPPVERPKLANAINDFIAGQKLVGALLGQEGAGKTWAAITALSAAAEDISVLPIVVSADNAKKHDDAFDAVVAALKAIGQEQGVRLQSPEEYWRRRLGQWASARAGTSDQPTVLILVDGLDEALKITWPSWLSAVLERRWKGLFRILLTCREDVWRRSLTLEKSLKEDLERLPVDIFETPERDHYLSQRGVDIGHLAEPVLESAKHPRTAFHLTRLAETLPDLKRVTRELLFFEDYKNRWEVKAGATPFNPEQFSELVRGLARQAREAALRQDALSITHAEVTTRAIALTGPDRLDMDGVLSELIDGGWCAADPNDPLSLTFADNMLPPAVGLALAQIVRTQPVEEIRSTVQAFLEPWGADDLTERMLRACAAGLVFDTDRVRDETLEVILGLWRARPFRSDAAEDFWRRIHAFRPEFFLSLCERHGGESGDWLLEWGVAHLWLDHPDQRDLVERTLFGWLASVPLPGESLAEDVAARRFYEHGRRRQIRRVRALGKLGQSDWKNLIGQERKGNAFPPALIALRVLAHTPKEPFAAALGAWAVSSAMSLSSENREAVEATIRRNTVDWSETSSRLGQIARAFLKRGDKTSLRAASLLLQATGKPEDAELAASSYQRRPRPIRRSDAWLARDGHRLRMTDAAKPSQMWVMLKDLSRHAIVPDVVPDPNLVAWLKARLSYAGAAEGVELAEINDDAFGAAMRWAPTETLALVARTMTQRSTPVAARLHLAKRFSPVLSISERRRASRLAAGEHPGLRADQLQDRLALRMAERPFQLQMRLLQTDPSGRTWPDMRGTLLSTPTDEQKAHLLAGLDFEKPDAGVWAKLWLSTEMIKRFGRPSAMPRLNWSAATRTSPPDKFARVLQLAHYVDSEEMAAVLRDQDWASQDDDGKPVKFLGSTLLALLPDEQLRPLLDRIDSFILAKVYNDRPELAQQAGQKLLERLEDELLKPRRDRSFGGDSWQYSKYQTALQKLFTEHPARILLLLEEAWSQPDLRDEIINSFGTNSAWFLARAAAASAPEFVARMWRETMAAERYSSSDTIDFFPSQLPAGALFDQLRAEMLERASPDNTLTAAIRAIGARGHGAALAEFVESELIAANPCRRAFAITIAGFMHADQHADKLWNVKLLADQGPGWLSQVQAEARSSFEKATYAKHWVLTAVEAKDEVAAFGAYLLFRTIADLRAFRWFKERKLAHPGNSWRSQWLNGDSEERKRIAKAIEKTRDRTSLHSNPCRNVLPKI
jgi:hypothetical protein